MNQSDEQFERYQILVEKFELPERDFYPNLSVCSLSTQQEYNQVLGLFLKIFPDEVDSQKASELQEFQISKLEGNLVAKIEEKVVGFLISGIINQVGYISYLGVDEHYRGCGVATALLQEFKEFLNHNQIKKVRCTIRKDNKKTLGYIKYLGFQLL
ncbi:MAG: GNAT family N-acetyltransferase [Candidatus Helarchaeota archaeon]